MNPNCQHILLYFMNITHAQVCLDNTVTWSAGIPTQALRKSVPEVRNSSQQPRAVAALGGFGWDVLSVSLGLDNCCRSLPTELLCSQ